MVILHIELLIATIISYSNYFHTTYNAAYLMFILTKL